MVSEKLLLKTTKIELNVAPNRGRLGLAASKVKRFRVENCDALRGGKRKIASTNDEDRVKYRAEYRAFGKGSFEGGEISGRKVRILTRGLVQNCF